MHKASEWIPVLQENKNKIGGKAILEERQHRWREGDSTFTEKAQGAQRFHTALKAEGEARHSAFSGQLAKKEKEPRTGWGGK